MDDSISQINVIYHVNKKEKLHDHLHRCRKSTSQNLTIIHDKKSLKVGIEGTYLNIKKAIYDKLTANITHSGKRLKAFPLNSRTRQRCPLTTYILKSIGNPRHSTQTRKRTKGHPNRKVRSKTVQYLEMT